MPKKILLIDDDVLVLKSTGSLLERQGYQVTRAKNCEEAIQCINSANFDLIISDIRMPGNDGIATVKKIKEKLTSSSQSLPPFILITGYASEEAPIQAIKLRASDYVLKPFDNDLLVSSIKKALESADLQLDPAELLQQISRLVNQYQSQHEKEIFDKDHEKIFFNRLSELIFLLEKSILEKSAQ